LFPVRAAEFGTAAQNAFTAAVGPPMSEAPVSMAAKFAFAVLMALPFKVRPEKHAQISLSN
jgi:hypothetical protein